MKPAPIIQTFGLSIGYGSKGGRRNVVHDDLNLALFPSEVTCLLGLNGAGKSTLLRTLCGLHPPLGGEILLAGKRLQAYSPTETALMIGVALTEKTNAGGLTVYELAALGRHPYTGFFGRLSKRDREAVEQSLEAAGIAPKARQYVSELSDGERQKAMIAKTLAQECPIILLDEPTAFLDVTSRIETMLLLRKLAKEQQKTVLLSTHDIDHALQTGDCFWLLAKDRPPVCGTPEDLILNNEFASFFGKEGIVFDLSTGKLNAEVPATPVGVEGDAPTAYWVGNALLRNGWKPSPPAGNYTGVNCVNPRQLIVTFPDGSRKTARSVAELLDTIYPNKYRNMN